MARKLFVLVALISLVALGQATPGLAAMEYDLTSGPYDWIEVFPGSGGNYTPGASGSNFSGWHETVDGEFWLIGGEYNYDPNDDEYNIHSPLKVTDEPGGPGDTTTSALTTFVYTYDDSVVPNEERFTVNIPNELSFVSKDLEFTITATYIYTGDSNHLWNFQNNNDVIATIEGGGTTFPDGIPFTISGRLWEDYGNHTHLGHFIDLQLTYGASVVPIPGAVWLLGTGLIGLFCLGRRRKV